MQLSIERKSIIKFFLVLGITLFIQVSIALASNAQQIKMTHPVVKVKSQHDGEVVILIHGLLRSRMSMEPLKAYLQREGYIVYNYNYSSLRYTIREHGTNLNQYIDTILLNTPGVKIHFVTHSIGGIIVREALSRRSDKQLANIGSLVMLAPPNQGSVLAKYTTKIFPIISYFIKPLAELSSDPSAYVHRVPIPKIKMGIIVGRYDLKVPPSAGHLEGQNEPVVVNSTHTFIMYSSQTKQLVKNFLENGTF